MRPSAQVSPVSHPQPTYGFDPSSASSPRASATHQLRYAVTLRPCFVRRHQPHLTNGYSVYSSWCQTNAGRLAEPRDRGFPCRGVRRSGNTGFRLNINGKFGNERGALKRCARHGIRAFKRGKSISQEPGLLPEHCSAKRQKTSKNTLLWQ